MNIWYHMDDSNPGSGMLPMAPDDAAEWNQRGHGIFATVQEFRSSQRRIGNLKRIRAWAIDIDEGSKADQIKRISRSPVNPSSVVETKNGHHVYFYAEGASPEHYRPLLDRIVHFFGADKNARDLARVLRVPGYLHLKDPADPFMVRHIFGPHRRTVYKERSMFRLFPAVETEQVKLHRETRPSGAGDDFWERVYNLDCVDALERLSGSGYVGGEQFSFTPVAGGRKHNIVVDGKSSSCWIDENGRIGSSDDGGPTVYQWLRWYRHSPGECARIIKEIYPGLEANQ